MSDLAQIDALVGEFFRCFDNRLGRVPCARDMAGFFVDTAIVTQHRQGKCEFYSPREFAQPRADLLASGTLIGFHEWEVDATTAIFGPIATRVSHYAKSGSLNGVDCSGNGTKLFQLVKLEARWHVAALSWFDGTDEEPSGAARRTP
jgi:ribosomal-protein-serine acetyltransferase